jgi:hypothetical protein
MPSHVTNMLCSTLDCIHLLRLTFGRSTPSPARRSARRSMPPTCRVPLECPAAAPGPMPVVRSAARPSMPARWRAAPGSSPASPARRSAANRSMADDVPCRSTCRPRPVLAAADRCGVFGIGNKHYRSLGSSISQPYDCTRSCPRRWSPRDVPKYWTRDALALGQLIDLISNIKAGDQRHSAIARRQLARPRHRRHGHAAR